jgi:hypothetical protein
VEIDFYSGDDPDRDSKVCAQNGFGSCHGVIPSTVRPFYISIYKTFRRRAQITIRPVSFILSVIVLSSYFTLLSFYFLLLLCCFLLQLLGERYDSANVAQLHSLHGRARDNDDRGVLF